MLNSLYDFPRQIERFWTAGIGIQIQVLILLGFLYFLGYFTAILLKGGVWWKWLLCLLILGPLVIPFLESGSIIFVGPITIGAARAFFKDSRGFAPYEWLQDIIYRVRSFRYNTTAHQETSAKEREAEEALKRAQTYEEQARRDSQKQANDKEKFREEMKRERNRQERDAKNKSRHSSSQGSNTHSNQQRNTDTAKPQKETEKDTRSPRDILGLSKEFTQAELKKARNAAIMRCHSDKWTDKPKAMQKVMEEETKKINWAYEKLKVVSSTKS